jgi:hypothetical protein
MDANKAVLIIEKRSENENILRPLHAQAILITL